VNPPVPQVVSRILPDTLIPVRNGVTVWLAGVKREGEWILPRIFRVFSCMGDVEIDLTTARIGAGESEIEVLCILSNVEIRVPADIKVLCDGDGMGGNFDVKRIGETTPPENAPVLRITGTAYLGSVTVTIKGQVGPGWMERLLTGWRQ
jgi:hypothetical protein